jgi:hypothetical protein
VIELNLPSYSLSRPLLRVELELQIAGPLRVRISSEISGILGIDDALRKPTHAANNRWVGGGERALHLRPDELLAVELSYRKAHVHGRHHGNPQLSDVARFVTVGVISSY